MPSKLSKKELTDIIQWDLKNWKNALPFWEAHFNIKAGMKVLALGERDGGLSLYFAQKGCEVICSDFKEITERAIQLHHDYKVDDKITYAKIDMCEIPFPEKTFDIVVFKSVIGALESQKDQDKAVAEIQRVLKDNGGFLFAENAAASELHQYLRKKFIKWQSAWRYVSDTECEAWKKKFSKSFTKKFGFIALFGRSERQRKILSSIDSVLNYIVPKSWRYIYFWGFCEMILNEFIISTSEIHRDRSFLFINTSRPYQIIISFGRKF